jgi:hypothetical protein
MLIAPPIAPPSSTEFLLTDVPFALKSIFKCSSKNLGDNLRDAVTLS